MPRYAQNVAKKWYAQYLSNICPRHAQDMPKVCPKYAQDMAIRVGRKDEKSSNLHRTADSTGSVHKNTRGKKFDPKKGCLWCGDLI